MAYPINNNNRIIALPGVRLAAGGQGYGGMPPTNLPTPATAFIGRSALVDEIVSLVVAEDVRILTLTGPGGVGKTRIALKACEALLSDFEDGVFFVSLAPVADPSLVVSAVASALGVKESGNALLADTLAGYLRDRSILLLLDNFEQVIVAGPDVAGLLAGAPGVRLMITSRTSLRLYGEHEYAVPPMDLPDDNGKASLTETARSEAVRLFVAMGRAIKPGFSITASNAQAVTDICRRLDGLPLAIELAATRLRLFSPQALLARLDKALLLLTGGAFDLPARQRTLRNAMDWSYNLLSDVEQQLFALMSVFAGGCMLDAAQSVCATLLSETDDLVDRLQSLIAQNLLRQSEQADGEPRLWMLQTIREYGLEKLAESGKSKQAQQAHALYYLGRAEAARPHLRDSEQAVWLESLESDHDNFRTAITFLLEQSDRTLAIRMAGALSWFWYVRGYLTEGSRWFDLILPPEDEQSENDERGGSYQAQDGEETLFWRAQAFRGAGTFAFMKGDYTKAIVYTRQSLEMARKLTDRSMAASALNNLSTILSQQGDLKQARPYLEESLELKRQTGDRAGIAIALGNLALNSERTGDYDLAHSLNAECIAIAREIGDKTHLALNIHIGGMIALRESKLEQAIASFSESLDMAREVGFKSCELSALSDMGMALCDGEDVDGAQAMLDEALQLSREMGDLTEESGAKLGLGRVALLRGDHALARRLMQEALRLRIQLREYNPSTVETLEWLATVEVSAAQVQQGNSESGIRAATLLGATHARREEMGTPIPPIWRERHIQTAASARTLLGPPLFSTAWEKGRAMPFSEAMALGIQEIPSSDGATSTQIPTQAQSQTTEEGSNDLNLTSRETDVLRLIAMGMTNKEIAERLVLSHRTVEAHLYSIFNKIDVTTRSAATRYAMEHGIVRSTNDV